MPVNIDEATLEKVASITGGKYFRATDTDSLAGIYAEIDQLEKTKVEAQHFVDYRELAVQSYAATWMTMPPLLLIAFALLTVRLVASTDLATGTGIANWEYRLVTSNTLNQAQRANMDIQIGNPNSIFLLGFVAVGLAAAAWAIVARRRAASRFATREFSQAIDANLGSSRHWASALVVSASLALLAVALMDIRWGKTWREVPQKGIEVMFVLDVSRSMLAEDASPNRLRRAKQQIKDMVDEMAGDRVGLVTFAGETCQSVPLTSHYEDFKQTLDSVGPHTVRSGGSRLG